MMEFNYEKVKEYLTSLNSLGSKPGLESIRVLLAFLSNPQEKIKVIHIAGTNGKGSVGAFINSSLVTAGYKTGRYSSPAVMEELEIIQLSGRNITEEEFVEVMTSVIAACKVMVEKGYSHPTRFEVETAAAILFFYKNDTDIAIIECGMGGRLDATNVFESNICSIITTISIDHTAFLGDTIEKITEEKAGIIKKGCPVLTNNEIPGVLQILEKECNKKATHLLTTAPVNDIKIDKARLQISFSYKSYSNVRLSMCAKYQVKNAILAIEVLELLCKYGFEINRQNIITGLYKTVWSGRFEIIDRSPLFIVDGAHNPDGAKALAESIEEYFHGKKITYLIGIFKDKNIKGILDELLLLEDTQKIKELQIVVIQTENNERAMPSVELAHFITEKYNKTCYFYDNIKEGVRKCQDITDSKGIIISFGSLSNIYGIKKILENDK